MNLAFSTKFHRVSSFADFIKIADELRYEGIEIHDIKADAFSGKASPFNPDMASVTKRTLINAKKAIACIDVDCNVADKASAEENMQKIETAAPMVKMMFFMVICGYFFSSSIIALATADDAPAPPSSMRMSA